MNNTQNLQVINNIDLGIIKLSNTFVNKLSFGINKSVTFVDLKLLYLYKRVLKLRTFDSNEVLSSDEYDNIYIDIQRITKKIWQD